MDAETILIAKKFSGSADVSAAKTYKEAAEAAAEQAKTAASSVPSNVSTTLTELQNQISTLETSIENIETGTVSVEGNTGDIVRVSSDGTLYAGDRPITKLLEVTVPQDVTSDTDSNITWVADENNAITGFVITEDSVGNTIDSYNHDKYLLTVTNVVNNITNEGTSVKTMIIDTDYVNGSSSERNARSGYMYYTLPYANIHQIVVTLGVNAAGCAYIDLDYGTSTKMNQFFPAGTVTQMGKRYQNNMNTDHIKAVSFVTINSTLVYGTVIRLWKV